MTFISGLIVGLFAGTFIGMLTMCIMIVAVGDDEEFIGMYAGKAWYERPDPETSRPTGRKVKEVDDEN